EQGRVDAEVGGPASLVAVEGDLGEDLLATAPGGADALEGRAVAEAEAGEAVVERVDVGRLGAFGRPRSVEALDRGRLLRRRGQDPVRVADPLGRGLVGRPGPVEAGEDRHRA